MIIRPFAGGMNSAASEPTGVNSSSRSNCDSCDIVSSGRSPNGCAVEPRPDAAAVGHDDQQLRPPPARTRQISLSIGPDLLAGFQRVDRRRTLVDRIIGRRAVRSSANESRGCGRPAASAAPRATPASARRCARCRSTAPSETASYNRCRAAACRAGRRHTRWMARRDHPAGHLPQPAAVKS